ncbi:Cof-type HAD-IIB family hydrolase [Loigolactobacillus zhaoyuanensis]|uniref:Cof-type HAD-IIB family hydrolase n=1 Tax=Loigolactobacillus zhaoyuanensis TaxID=2486017 RepID=A0ABW8UBA5_9LACO|nr:Cof-type HAD-IIB family hydrolase [Loigolactobacillus zhaoyuanensis]
MYKAVVFFDLDGTLFDNDKQVTAASVKAIAQLKANNILPVIATGRSLFEITGTLEQAGIDSCVCADGSYIQVAGRALKTEYLKTADITAITEYAQQNDLAVSYYNSNGFVVSHENKLVRANYQELQERVTVAPEAYLTTKVNMLFVFSQETDKQDDVYRERYKGTFSFYRNNMRGLDVVKAGVSKRSGIEYLLNHMDLEALPTYGFGDFYNDLPMFEVVKTPIAMGNAVPEMKAKAAWVTASNMDNGIVKGLQHYNLI